MNIKHHYLILAAIILVAAFLRVYKLDTIPPGLWPDEALNGTQALEEPFKLFYPENNGREGLIMASRVKGKSRYGLKSFIRNS